jgi:hypothetical protein
MHQTVKLASVGSVGDLGHIAQALGDAGFNIEAIGGAEAMGVREDGRGIGVISLLVEPDEESDLSLLRRTLDEIVLGDDRRLAEATILPSLDVVFRHERGALGRAAAALGQAGVNIQSILLVDAHGSRAVVSMAFDPSDVDSARAALEGAGFEVLEKHGAKDIRDRNKQAD